MLSFFLTSCNFLYLPEKYFPRRTSNPHKHLNNFTVITVRCCLYISHQAGQPQRQPRNVCNQQQYRKDRGKINQQLLKHRFNLHTAHFYADKQGGSHRRRNESISCSELIIGMKCGGSDGLSGITANPTVGRFSDLLVSRRGTTILTEVPEMFGAETLLMNRCETRELFDKTVSLINDFKNYFTSHNQTIYENPSPGNKKGGISTLEYKSMDCTQKSGSAPVKGVLSYGEPVCVKGLNLLSAPGNDLVASTALAASGAHIVLFTTGRGTPFASPVPTVKISSNTPLYEHKKNWIDFNCGSLVDGKPLDVLGEELFDYVIRIASGEKVKSEEAGFHDMAIFKQGVTL